MAQAKPSTSWQNEETDDEEEFNLKKEIQIVEEKLEDEVDNVEEYEDEWKQRKKILLRQLRNIQWKVAEKQQAETLTDEKEAEYKTLHDQLVENFEQDLERFINLRDRLKDLKKQLLERQRTVRMKRRLRRRKTEATK